LPRETNAPEKRAATPVRGRVPPREGEAGRNASGTPGGVEIADKRKKRKSLRPLSISRGEGAKGKRKLGGLNSVHRKKAHRGTGKVGRMQIKSVAGDMSDAKRNRGDRAGAGEKRGQPGKEQVSLERLGAENTEERHIVIRRRGRKRRGNILPSTGRRKNGKCDG